ncbi:MAG: methionyl-tRNA formyltransferase [Candidatus Magasanikbacteria bacterium]|nr:methionyl-tRNA formyltransferase [Candidatus Magasanikbacteria bacterium]
MAPRFFNPSPMIRIIFFGTENFAVPILNALLSDPRFSVAAVVTKPDQPAGRGRAVTAPPIKKEATAVGIPIFQPEKLSDPKFVSALSAQKADVAVVVQYGKIIPTAVLSLFPRGAVNVHGSLLPKYRGPSPIQTGLLNGEKETGVTIMLIDEEMDHGPILSQERLAITAHDTSETLFTKLAEISARLLPETIIKFLDGALTPQPQNHRLATYTKIIEREDGRVRGDETPDDLERKLRAFTPWPGVFADLQGKRIKILALSPLLKEKDEKFSEHQNVLRWWKTPAGQPALTVHKGSIILHRVQLEGGKAMDGTDFAHGYQRFFK